MSSHNCYLCASDEGILLDIFADGGKTHCGKIETCLSVKIEESNVASTKICHKCAYELDACSKFVQKYRATKDVRRAKSKYSKTRCVLCCEPGIKGYIFELCEGTSFQNSLRKIQEIFNDKFFNDQTSSLSICLNCRYNLDVLFDLKCIHQTTLDKLSNANKQESNATEYPKTKTSVVRRKTTYIPLPQLNGDKDHEIDSNTTNVMPMRRKRGRPRKDSISLSGFRTCEQCKSSVDNGIDMYRYHRTGRTVCKECWLTMDPEKIVTNKSRKMGLVLKDVLLHPSKYTNIYKVEKDEYGNTTCLITDDSSESEEKEKTPLKRTRRSQRSVRSPIEEEAILTIPDKKKAVKRGASGKLPELEYEPPAKVTVRGRRKLDDTPSTSNETKSQNAVFTSDSEVIVRRTRANSSASSKKDAKAASLSDVDSSKPLPKKMGQPRKTPIASPTSPPKTVTKTATARTRRAAQRVATADKKTDETIRPLRRTRTNSLTSQDVTIQNHSDSKSLSESGSPPSKIRRSKTKSLSPKNTKSHIDIDSIYSCGVCNIEYRNKLICMAHQMSHGKQPEVKLQRVAIPEIVIEEAPAEISLIEEPEEQSHDVSSTSDHKSNNADTVKEPKGGVPMETETITVNTNVDQNCEKVNDSEIIPMVKDKNVLDDETIEDKVLNSDNVQCNDKDKNEDKTDAPVVQEMETSDENKKDDENISEVMDNDGNVTKLDNENNVEKINNESNVEKLDSESNVEKLESESNVEKLDSESNVEKLDSESNVEKMDCESNVEKMDCENNVEKIDCKSNMEKIDDRSDAEAIRVDEIHETMDDAPEEQKIESTSTEIITPKEKQLDNTEIIEELFEKETAKESTETPIKSNGVDAEHETNSEIIEVEKEEKSAVKLDDKSDCKDVDICRSEESIDRDNTLPITLEIPEKENNDTDPPNDEDVRNDENVAPMEQINDKLESLFETKSPEVKSVADDAQPALRKESESISAVTEICTEVFNLATAEVQKRLDSETPNDGKCAEPVDETLENISLEIQNSADMPSLEDVGEEQSAKNQS